MSPQRSGSAVVCLGHHQPARTLTNAELATSLDTSDRWISERVGVRSRQIAGPDESVADMACAAAAKALARSGFDATDIDLVVVATATSLHRMPNVAARVAAHLGIPTPAAYDINAACAGFCYALAAADQAIQAGAAGRAIVVGADKMSDFVDWSDRSSAVIFGDGAGAAVIAAGRPGIGPVVWGSEPAKGRAITVEPAECGTLFRQDGQAVFRWATTSLAPIALKACRTADVDPAELGGIVTHQANLRIIQAIAGKIGAPDAVLATDVVESGNTSAASIPLALSKLIERHEIPSGAPVLLFGFGAGLSYAGQVIRCP
ncbi:MAG TPA: beta-ketoacyl-ACP synthase 3 [Pseudonocardiaceae bacterium]|nr:beta-ketoacyl-ACP synthase 3 [Pseudonocardiaceae bacterium]